LLQQPFYFGHAGNTTLTHAARRYAKEVAAILKTPPAIIIQLEGHTCDIGTAATNDRIALARARAVAAFLQHSTLRK